MNKCRKRLTSIDAEVVEYLHAVPEAGDHGGRVPWPDLPADTLGEVLRFQPSFGDRARFGAICRLWRDALRSQPAELSRPPMPWLVFPGYSVGLQDGAICRVALPEEAARGTLCVGSFGNWLALAPAPLSPPLKLRPVLVNADRPDARVIPLPEWTGPDGFSRIPKIALMSEPTLSSCVAAALVNDGRGGSKTIASCRPGAQDSCWSTVTVDLSILDMVFYKGKLYVLDKFLELHVFAVHGSQLVHCEHIPVHPPILEYRSSSRCGYLVECGEKLLMVTRLLGSGGRTYLRRTKHFTIFELDRAPAGLRWARVGLLPRGQALFVSDAGSRAFRAGKVGENMVFFSDNEVNMPLFPWEFVEVEAFGQKHSPWYTRALGALGVAYQDGGCYNSTKMLMRCKMEDVEGALLLHSSRAWPSLVKIRLTNHKFYNTFYWYIMK